MSSEHLPVIEADNAPFWEALALEIMLVSYCPHCDQCIYYPRVYCPTCWTLTEWCASSGRGEVVASTTIRQNHMDPFRQRVPYNVSLVELEEGPRLLTNVVGCDPLEVSVGSIVRLAPSLEEGWWLPTFKLAFSPGSQDTDGH